MAAFRNRTFRGYSHERAPRCARAASGDNLSPVHCPHALRLR
nr:MAG TPA: hypothetical protein [Caudoviricetes sp.]